MGNLIRFLFEIIGTIAFSVSGAVVGMEKKMDILGVATLGLITAVGGGILRDLLIGVTPPNAFHHPIYAIVALLAAIFAFLPSFHKWIDLDHFAWVLVDSIGLGAFTMIGVTAGMDFDNAFLEIFLGVATGVGGGVMRDICAGNLPMIFVRHFYACPCIIGAILCVALYGVDPTAAVVCGFVSIVILRLLAARFKWHLPKTK